MNSVRCLAERGGRSAHVLEMIDEKDPLDNIITRFKLHPSIVDIKNKGFSDKFDFTLLSTDDVLSELKKLDHKKSTTGLNVKLLKKKADIYALIFAPILTRIFNSCITDGVFPDKLKLAEISPIFKSIDSMAKKIYGPVSILNSVSKLFEKLIQKQLNLFFDKKLSQ